MWEYVFLYNYIGKEINTSYSKQIWTRRVSDDDESLTQTVLSLFNGFIKYTKSECVAPLPTVPQTLKTTFIPTHLCVLVLQVSKEHDVFFT